MQHHGVKNEAFVSVYIETPFVNEFCVWADIRNDLKPIAKRIFMLLK